MLTQLILVVEVRLTQQEHNLELALQQVPQLEVAHRESASGVTSDRITTWKTKQATK
jgi:hypothetical protein